MNHLNILTAFIPLEGAYYRASRHPDPEQNALQFLGGKVSGPANEEWAGWYTEAKAALALGEPHELLPDAGFGGSVANNTMRRQPWFAVFEADNVLAGDTDIWAARLPANLTPVSGAPAGDPVVRFMAGNPTVAVAEARVTIMTNRALRSKIFEDIGSVDNASSGLKEQGCSEAGDGHQRRNW